MAERAARKADVDRELARARGARRLLPWSAATAAGAAALVAVAGGGLRGALAVAALGLLFAAFLWSTSIARCPACGAPLPRTKRPGPRSAGPAGVERLESCPRCLTRYV